MDQMHLRVSLARARKQPSPPLPVNSHGLYSPINLRPLFRVPSVLSFFHPPFFVFCCCVLRSPRISTAMSCSRAAVLLALSLNPFLALAQTLSAPGQPTRSGKTANTFEVIGSSLVSAQQVRYFFSDSGSGRVLLARLSEC